MAVARRHLTIDAIAISRCHVTFAPPDLHPIEPRRSSYGGSRSARDKLRTYGDVMLDRLAAGHVSIGDKGSLPRCW
jgi:hypothetical protein